METHNLRKEAHTLNLASCLYTWVNFSCILCQFSLYLLSVVDELGIKK